MTRFPTCARPRLMLGLALVVALLAACSSGGSKSSAPTTTTLPPRFPLTGVRPPAGTAAVTRPAIAVKIDNISAARPQSGLDAADVVYEELAEGGLTRFVAVFQSTDAPEIGPVRSVRPSDANIVLPLNGALVCSGGSAAAIDFVKAAGVNLVEIESVSGASTRRRDRSAPQNLYTSTEVLYENVGGGLPAPPPFADFLEPGQPFAAVGAVPATSLMLSPGSAVDAAYTWDAATGTWPRTTDGEPHLVESGAQVAPTNVIVQFTPYSEFPGDSKVSVAETIGGGEAWVLTAGTLVRGTWEKPAPTSVTVFKDPTGAPLRLPPGRTWVQVMEPGSPAVPA